MIELSIVFQICVTVMVAVLAACLCYKAKLKTLVEINKMQAEAAGPKVIKIPEKLIGELVAKHFMALLDMLADEAKKEAAEAISENVDAAKRGKELKKKPKLRTPKASKGSDFDVDSQSGVTEQEQGAKS